jgi:hypothetical protein
MPQISLKGLMDTVLGKGSPDKGLAGKDQAAAKERSAARCSSITCCAVS